LREGIVRVNLDGKRLGREQQLEQQGRVWRIDIGALKPEFADRDAIIAHLAPGAEFDAAPGFAHRPHGSALNRQKFLLILTA
jgi:hypothetical protein